MHMCFIRCALTVFFYGWVRQWNLLVRFWKRSWPGSDWHISVDFGIHMWQEKWWSQKTKSSLKLHVIRHLMSGTQHCLWCRMWGAWWNTLVWVFRESCCWSERRESCLVKTKCLEKMKEHTSESRWTTDFLYFDMLFVLGKVRTVVRSVTAASPAIYAWSCPIIRPVSHLENKISG